MEIAADIARKWPKPYKCTGGGNKRLKKIVVDQDGADDKT